MPVPRQRAFVNEVTWLDNCLTYGETEQATGQLWYSFSVL